MAVQGGDGRPHYAVHIVTNSQTPPVAVITVTYSPGRHLAAFLDSLPAATAQGVYVVLADNGSRDGVPEEAASRSGNVEFLPTGGNLGYGAGMNAGARQLRPLRDAGEIDPEFLVLSNPDLKPEKSNTMDLGLSFTSSNRFFNGDITWFKTRHNDKIVEYTFKRNNDLGEEITITSYKNADKSNHEGIELMGSANFGTLFDNRFKLELYSNFTFMLDYTFDETKADVTTTYDMLYVRKSNGSFGILFDNYNGFQTRINGRYIGNRLEKDSFSALRPNITADHYYTKGGYEAKDKILELPNHIVFDWSVYYTYAGNKRFGIGVSNLLDENYSEKDGYNMPGRMVTGSFSFLF